MDKIWAKSFSRYSSPFSYFDKSNCVVVVDIDIATTCSGLGGPALGEYHGVTIMSGALAEDEIGFTRAAVDGLFESQPCAGREVASTGRRYFWRGPNLRSDTPFGLWRPSLAENRRDEMFFEVATPAIGVGMASRDENVFQLESIPTSSVGHEAFMECGVESSRQVITRIRGFEPAPQDKVYTARDL